MDYMEAETLLCYLGHEQLEVPPTDAFREWLDVSTAAVASIDMHRSHVGPEDELPSAAPRARDQIPAHNAFYRAARDLGVPVIHVQHVQRHGGIDEFAAGTGGANWRVLRSLTKPPNPLLQQLGWDGTKWIDLMTEAKESDYHVRTKKRFSAFYPTDLEFLLRQLGVKTLVLTGTLTHACVLATAFDAHDRDFRLIVPRDLVAGTSSEAETAAMTIIGLHLGLVVDWEDLISEWRAQQQETPRSRAESSPMLPKGTAQPIV